MPGGGAVQEGEQGAFLRRHLGGHILQIVAGAQKAQPAAIGLYRSFGYVQIPCYNEYAYDPHSLCFEKRLEAADTAPVPENAVTDG